jgi:hypothetical protein
MFVTGIALVAIAIIGLWLCLPAKHSSMKWFLRGGGDVLATVAIVGCLGVGIIFLVSGVTQKEDNQSASAPAANQVK